jgi:hypothetical protein
MRLSDWRRQAPHRESMTARVLGVVEPVLSAMGADDDPECWVAWGDDPSIRYAVLAPTGAGLVVANIRVNNPGEGPRATAKLVRWPRVQLGELSIETHGGRRLLSFQVEGQILRGADADADRVSAFALWLMASADGRPRPQIGSTRSRRRGPSKAGAKSGTTTRTAAKPSSRSLVKVGTSRTRRTAG